MKYILAFVSLLALSACATNITPLATGGSRADGNVVVSYQYGMFQQPVIDWASADASAKARCKAWGYHKAERFEGQQSTCLERNGYGNCLQQQVNVTYQCTK